MGYSSMIYVGQLITLNDGTKYFDQMAKFNFRTGGEYYGKTFSNYSGGLFNKTYDGLHVNEFQFISEYKGDKAICFEETRKDAYGDDLKYTNIDDVIRWLQACMLDNFSIEVNAVLLYLLALKQAYYSTELIVIHGGY